ncbi:MAG: GNAT family N-acetyltransferase [Jannaschia helgolandensis]|nr:GNAT family N-acetyltransferase [Jannaschia helgolandensis]
MTPKKMAALHAQAFDGSARWSAESFTAMLDRSDTIIVSGNDGFALGRVMADEAELLTIVVALAQRGQGTARTLLSDFDREARKLGATQAFLEVAADNAPARALYAATGWIQVGLRPGYYDGTDARLLRKTL